MIRKIDRGLVLVDASHAIAPFPLSSGFRVSHQHTHIASAIHRYTNNEPKFRRGSVSRFLCVFLSRFSIRCHIYYRDELFFRNGESRADEFELVDPNVSIFFLLGTGVRVVVQTRIENSDAFANSKTKRFPCPNCTSAFGQKPSLTRHLRYECRQEPRFQCPYCQQRSKKTSDIYAHIRRKHANLKVFVIDIHGSVAHSSFNSFKIDRL